MLWDIFCKVIDNHGDLGVCWRLCADLAQRGHHVRLWVDDPQALAWMAPGALEGAYKPEGQAAAANIQIRAWDSALQAPQDIPSDVWIEAFGCELPAHFLTQASNTLNRAKLPVWLNLEYLSAEFYVQRSHRLPSPVQHGPLRGHTKWFYYPGFNDRTGGLLREPNLAARQAAFDAPAWRARADALALPSQREAPTPPASGCRTSLFCYEPAVLGQALALSDLNSEGHRWWVTHGRAHQAVVLALNQFDLASPKPSWTALPALSQFEFDHLLWASDLNFVRGEDSLVRALWAGKPLVWHIYPQDDNAHHAKLEAFLDWRQAPESLRRAHRVWNGVEGGELLPLQADTLSDWGHSVKFTSPQLLTQRPPDSQLIQLANELQRSLTLDTHTKG